jgi:stress-induced morphogen
MLSPDSLERLIVTAFPDARVHVTDLTGTQDHYEVSIVSSHFRGLPKIKQHRLVHEALREQLKGPIHALSLKTSAE